VRWIDDTAAGQTEPDHPAPVLNLAAASTDTSSGAATSTGPSVAVKADTKSSNGTGTATLTIAIIGGVFGLAGLVLGGPAFTHAPGERSDPYGAGGGATWANPNAPAAVHLRRADTPPAWFAAGRRPLRQHEDRLNNQLSTAHAAILQICDVPPARDKPAPVDLVVACSVVEVLLVAALIRGPRIGHAALTQLRRLVLRVPARSR
jgi:hypothetical protein